MANSKKRGRAEVASEAEAIPIDTSKPTAVFKPSGRGRTSTVTIALPGSIIANAVTQDSKTQLAGQLARALAVFCIDEVVIFEDGTKPPQQTKNHGQRRSYYEEAPAKVSSSQEQYCGNSDPSAFLEHILSYLETPPFLRRRLFPHHPNLASSGQLPSLDMPHHLRADEPSRYREGITLTTPHGSSAHDSHHTLVDVGYEHPVLVPVPDVDLPPETRVTVRAVTGELQPLSKRAEGVIAHPREPREAIGLYWGYSIRRAGPLSEVFTGCPFATGYDLSLGTSERGIPLHEFLRQQDPHLPADTPDAHPFQHLVIFFGGVAGLEPAVRNDRALDGVGQVGKVFDHWINVLPGQGSRTIRTEEALWIALGQLSGWMGAQG